MCEMKRNREYRSCYSCDYSEIHGDRKGRTIVCNKSLRIYKPKAGECYPEWCELKGINDERIRR